MLNFDVIIIGAGASGLMCAIRAGQRGKKVLVIEHNKEAGKKILISGGGRCNFTNLHVSKTNFRSSNEHFCISALSRFSPSDFLKLVKKHEISFFEKKLGQLFCRNSAKEIVQMLLKESNEAGVCFAYETKIDSINRYTDNLFKICCHNLTYLAPKLVIATGGLSVPKVGASDFGYRVAEQFNIKVTKLFPALDGFRFRENQFTELAGVSVFCRIESQCGMSFEENLLFTHHGLSGPAALQASLYWNLNEEIKLNLLPHEDAVAWLLSIKKSGVKNSVKKTLSQKLPNSLVEFVLKEVNISDKEMTQASHQELKVIGEKLNYWTLFPTSTIGYNKAELTRGGIDPNELSSKTMESKKVQGLYFVGEVVDVNGWLGGYNFQWAWASGWVAGDSI